MQLLYLFSLMLTPVTGISIMPGALSKNWNSAVWLVPVWRTSSFQRYVSTVGHVFSPVPLYYGWVRE